MRTPNQLLRWIAATWLMALLLGWAGSLHAADREDVALGGQYWNDTTGQATLDYYEGVLIFAGSGCAGASQQVGPSKLGVVRFARSDANPALAARWGELHTITGTRSGAIWALPSARQLCLLGDEIPSSRPSLSAVAVSVANLPADNCFVR